MSYPFLTTPEDTGILNTATPETEEIGFHLVRLCLNGEQPKDMCGDCAFRLGSVPNRSVTSHDALMCVISGTEFECHHGESRTCAGYQRAMELHPPKSVRPRFAAGRRLTNR